ncbi:MAG: histidine--tRNA ligase [Thiofilum sp.]|uniref:histidine--tRNA ligase n=1 Tax=Thiofilum sp. TaxID=2212733 RepID=UPI0025CF7EC7|nr:histidine--tRNA ligase [Thiofilum sp.]MBK8454098.1 histidine--tRNA ligase [Thiofilum sp.]
MASLIKSAKGMNDILPPDMVYWHTLESTVRNLFARYGFNEIRTPIVEATELFSRAVGEVTDIVEKEMYTFNDREKTSLSLRPEGTAGCVRAGLEHGLLYNQQQRFWYSGPMFRHERQQKGRYRQFTQIGAEAFGMTGPDIDADVIAMTARLWKELGLIDNRLELNSLGTPQSRQAYRALLVNYFSAYADQLDEDSKRRLHTNPLRILDTKNPEMKALVAGAPNLHDHLDPESAEHFAQLQALLTAMGIEFVINPRLVRGLDYYSRTVFEWITPDADLGSQSTVCAGGRYDGLVEQLGGAPTAGFGFAMGVERLVHILKNRALVAPAKPLALYFMVDSEYLVAGMAFAERLRSALPTLTMITNGGGGSLKAQIKRADKSGAAFGLTFDHPQQITLKSLRERTEPVVLTPEAALTQLPSLLNQKA